MYPSSAHTFVKLKLLLYIVYTVRNKSEMLMIFIQVEQYSIPQYNLSTDHIVMVEDAGG